MKIKQSKKCISLSLFFLSNNNTKLENQTVTSAVLGSSTFAPFNRMDQNLDNYNFSMETSMGITKTKKSNKCNQCEYASTKRGTFNRHLTTHTGEKSYICNQCDFAFAVASTLRTHLKTHSGEKTNKCNQCDYASSDVIMHPLRQAI